MNILFRYVAREVLTASLMALLVLTVLFTFFEFISELSEAHSATYTPWVASLFVLMNVPGRLTELMPLAVLIGGLFAWNRLSLASEFSVMRTAGLSTLRVATWMLMLGVLIGALALLFNEYVTPPSERAAQQLKVRATSGIVAQEFPSGLWAKDGRSFINIRELRPDAKLVDIRQYEFDAAFNLKLMRRAESASWQGGQWILHQVTQTVIAEDGTRSLRKPDQSWMSAVTPDLLAVLMIKPERMAITSLYTFIRHLDENRQDSKRYRIALWGKLAYPMAAPVMLILALVFAFNPPRQGGAGGRVLLGIMLGLGFHLSSRLAGQVAFLQDWPAPASAFMPVLGFGLVAVAALWWVERR
jgi:lipopolysaccharide export system permease protein